MTTKEIRTMAEEILWEQVGGVCFEDIFEVMSVKCALHPQYIAHVVFCSGSDVFNVADAGIDTRYSLN